MGDVGEAMASSDTPDGSPPQAVLRCEEECPKLQCLRSPSAHFVRIWRRFRQGVSGGAASSTRVRSCSTSSAGGAHGAVIAGNQIGVRKRLLGDDTLAISPPDWVPRYIDRLDSAEPAYGFISRQLALQSLDEIEAEIRSS